jgi:hypothetical protein
VWYWPGSFFDGTTSNIWTALAWEFAQGELYRPLVGPLGYGGTRYMPLMFIVHGLLIRAGLDSIHAGVVVMQVSVLAAALALFAALRAADVPARLAAPLSGTVWSTVVYQQYSTDLRPDFLAAAFAMTGAALALDTRRRGQAGRLVAASVFCVLAGLTKVTAMGVVAAIAIGLFVDRRRAMAARFAGLSLALFAAAITLIEFASGHDFLASFRATITGGMSAGDALRALPTFAEEVLRDPFVAAPFAVACWYGLIRPQPGLPTMLPLYFATSVLVTLVIFASPGTVANHLVDLQMTSALLIGAVVARSEPSARPVGLVYAMLAVVLIAISLPIPGIPSVVATLRAQGPRQRSVVDDVHAEFLADGARYLSTDPIVAVLHGQHPVIVDAVTLERFLREGAPAGRDIEQKIGRRAFDRIILRDTTDFPHDMDAGAPRFDEYAGRYWSVRNGELIRLFRSRYKITAVRKPFVILEPAQ